jgi:UDP-galactopyranose mutase
MIPNVDLLICGAGPVGCVIAERAANLLGWNVLIVEKRRHIAGNCHDSFHASGVMIQNYGPHYFRTNDAGMIDYLSRFTEWIPGNYEVRSFCQGQLFPFPINLTTLEQFYNRKLDARSARRLLERERSDIDQPSNSEEFVLSRVGRELYEAFYLNYTLKQWEIHPRDLASSVCGRIPVRFNRDNRYVDHRFQVMPRHGFTSMFGKMIDHPRIRVLLNADFREVQSCVTPRQATVTSGPVDEYFDYRFGKLPYRSLRFEMVSYHEEYKQPCVQINFPNDFGYTRSVETKHITGQKHPETVITYETPEAVGDRYYPIPRPENAALYQKYQALAEEETRRSRVHFCGRLAQYRYLNTDEVIAEALRCFEQIRVDSAQRPPTLFGSAADGQDGTAAAA